MSIAVTILYDNEVLRKPLRADWGFAVLIDDDGIRVLFDAGADADVLLHNARILGENLSTVSAVVLSHWHADHAGGLAAVAGIALRATYFVPFRAGVTWTGVTLNPVHEEPVQITEHVHSTGVINGMEQALVITSDSCPLLVTGCAHPSVEALTNAGFRVIAKDRLGWGRSSKAIVPYSLSLHASNMAALLDHLGVAEVGVVGHSMGGQVATRFAFLYPERTSHMVLVNPIGLTDNRAGRGFQPASLEVNVEPDLQAAYEADVRTDMNRYAVWKPEYLEHLRIRHGVRLSSEWPRLALVNQLGGNLRGIDSVVNDWPHIATKSMVLGGEDDGPNFPELARRAAESLPNGELVLFPEIGHNPHEEAPELVNAELIRFLSSDPAAVAAGN